MRNLIKTLIYVAIMLAIIGLAFLSYKYGFNKGNEQGKTQATQEMGEYIVNSLNTEGVLRIKDANGTIINLVPQKNE